MKLSNEILNRVLASHEDYFGREKYLPLYDHIVDELNEAISELVEKKFYSTCIKDSRIFGLEIGKKYQCEMDQYGDIRVVLPNRDYWWFIGGQYDEYFYNISETRKLKLKKINGSRLQKRFFGF